MSDTVLTTKPEPRITSQLAQLRQYSKIVADTGDFETLREYQPLDATTNPSLIYKAAQLPAYQHLLDQAISSLSHQNPSKALVGKIVDTLLVLFGLEILKIVPGRVSTETNANLSFDTAGLLANARQLIAAYEQHGISRERVLIKIASTWEGIQAAKILQAEHIHCNMTLLFSLPQAVACAQAKVTLLSPFVGRILDWHKKQTGQDYPPAADPGVLSVRTIYAYYKRFGISTEIMAASFRNIGEILELAGCDLLTISPQLLSELKNKSGLVARKLDEQLASAAPKEPLDLDEKQFRWLMNEDAMATEKLAEGIRLFHADALKLAHMIEQRL